MMHWTEERIEVLKKGWLVDGLSASQIAAMLGGVTRNAVIGKVHRLSLAGRAKPPAHGPRPRRATTSRRSERHVPGHARPRVPMAQPAPRRLPNLVPIEDLVVPISLNVPLLKLTDTTCKWPHGDGPNYLFCGHKNFNGLPYCEYHARLSYVPVGKGRAEERGEAARDRASALKRLAARMGVEWAG